MQDADMRKILVLDDSQEDRFFTRRSLRKASPDCELHEFAYAEDALSFLRSPERPQLHMLLVDISMPRMNGFAFADAYMELYPELRGNAPMVVMSGSINPDDKKRAEDHTGIGGYIEKPVTQDAIQRVFTELGEI